MTPVAGCSLAAESEPPRRRAPLSQLNIRPVALRTSNVTILFMRCQSSCLARSMQQQATFWGLAAILMGNVHRNRKDSFAGTKRLFGQASACCEAGLQSQRMIAWLTQT